MIDEETHKDTDGSVADDTAKKILEEEIQKRVMQINVIRDNSRYPITLSSKYIFEDYIFRLFY